MKSNATASNLHAPNAYSMSAGNTNVKMTIMDFLANKNCLCIRLKAAGA
jgi:hypothetical protein